MKIEQNTKDLSVIIVSYKARERLIQCLDALNLFTGKFTMEVLVIDNSCDDTFHEIQQKYPKFKCIRNSINGGFSYGCNVGAQKANGEFLLFLNPDTIALEEEVSKLLIQAQQNPDYYMLSCRQHDENGKENRVCKEFPKLGNMTGIQRAIARVFNKKKPETNKSEFSHPDWVWGSVMMIKKEKFKLINGFDEDFWMHWEDIDICKRIHDKGGKIAYFKNISIEHNHGSSSRKDIRTYATTKKEVIVSTHIYVDKHFKGIEKFLTQAFLVINNSMTGCIAAILGIIFFFIPAIHKRTPVFIKLITYYINALIRFTWISPLSINYRRNKRLGNKI